MSILDGRDNALFIGFINAVEGKTVLEWGRWVGVTEHEPSGTQAEATVSPRRPVFQPRLSTKDSSDTIQALHCITALWWTTVWGAPSMWWAVWVPVGGRRLLETSSLASGGSDVSVIQFTPTSSTKEGKCSQMRLNGNLSFTADWQSPWHQKSQMLCESTKFKRRLHFS